MSPSKIASFMASLIIPISLEGFKLKVFMISSPETGGWKLRTLSFSSTSIIFSLTILIGCWASFFASTNHCSVNKGSIIELDRSP